MALSNLGLLGFILVTGIVSVVSDCPNGYVRHDDSCYKLFSKLKATWMEAVMYCKVFGSHLAIIETAREQNFLEGYLQNEYNSHMSPFVWLGATDALTEGEWKWVETGEDLIPGESYTKWYPGEPNAIGTSGEDCLNLFQNEKFMWNDSNCGLHYNFLCERSATTAVTLPPEIIG